MNKTQYGIIAAVIATGLIGMYTIPSAEADHRITNKALQIEEYASEFYMYCIFDPSKQNYMICDDNYEEAMQACSELSKTWTVSQGYCKYWVQATNIIHLEAHKKYDLIQNNTYLQNQLGLVVQSNIDLQNQLGLVVQSNTDLQNQLTAQIQNNTDLQNELAIIKQRLMHDIVEFGNSGFDIHQVIDQYEKLVENYGNSMMTIAYLEDEITLRDQHITNLYENIDSMNNTAHQLITYNDELKTTISNLESTITDLETQNNALERKNSELDELKQERNHYKELAQERLDKLQNLKDQRANTNNAIQDIIDALETDPNQLITNIIQQLKNLLK